MTDVRMYIEEMKAIEDYLYETVESQWTTLSEMSVELVQAGLTLNGLLITGPQADELVRYFFLDYYRKVQEHYYKPNFRTEILDVVEREFPDRSDYQIAVVEHPQDRWQWRIRKRIFKRLRDRYPEKFKVEHPPFVDSGKLIKPLKMYGDCGVYFYGEGVRDPLKIWIDPGAIELFLNLLFEAKQLEVPVHEIIDERCFEYLASHWFIIPEKKEYFPHVYVGTLEA